MKKTLTVFLFISVLTLFGCYNEVFYNINQDVLPESATVSGVVNSIARYQSTSGTEFLVCAADGGLRYKLASSRSHGAWHTYDNLPFELHYYSYYDETHIGQEIIKVLADKDTLYIVSVEYERDTEEGTNIPKRFNVYGKQISGTSDLDESGDWTNLTESITLYFYENSSGYYETNFNVFSTNAPQKAHRRVFIRNKDSAYYELSGLSLSDFAPDSSIDDNSTSKINSAAYYGNTLLFFKSTAVTTNESSTDSATVVYYGSYHSSKLGYYDGSAHAEQLDAGYEITCLAACSDALLIGRGNVSSSSTSSNGGIVKTSLSSGIPDTSLADFSTNAESQLSSSYILLTLLNVEPSQSELNSALYASLYFKGTGSSSSVSYDNVGLWSYYPSRGNWNRE